jgi:hypothetical protein
VSVEHKIDNRGARDKFWKIFLSAKKHKLIETYEALQKEFRTNRKMETKSALRPSKVTVGDAKSSPKKDYLLNVVLYSSVPTFDGQISWKGLYMMFSKDPHRQYQVKAPKVFPQTLIKKSNQGRYNKKRRIII